MDANIAYENRAFIPDGDSYPERWENAAREWREIEHAVGRARLNVSYGDQPRQKLDMFYPAGKPVGMIVFVHGGYWRAFDRNTWSHFSAGAVARGWAVAMPSYTLAPEARIAEITQEIALAIGAAAQIVDGPIVLTGHSAGGQLVARMACKDIDLSSSVEDRLVRILPISPLSDLRPLLETDMNSDLRLDMPEATAESPILHSDLRDVPVTVWVGAEERPALLDQARWLCEAWEGSKLHVAPGRHHFDVIDGLLDAESPLVDALLGTDRSVSEA